MSSTIILSALFARKGQCIRASIDNSRLLNWGLSDLKLSEVVHELRPSFDFEKFFIVMVDQRVKSHEHKEGENFHLNYNENLIIKIMKQIVKI